MARGFGATRGSTDNDLITTAYSNFPTLLSVHVWTYRNGEGESNFGRMLDMNATQFALLNSVPDAANTYSLYFNAANSGAYRWTRPAATTWAAIGFSVDMSSNDNDPIVYQGGSSVSLTEAVAPNYSAVTAGTWRIGNRAALDRCWNGDIAEVAIWSKILTPQQFSDLAGGANPLSIEAANLEEYIPMLTGASVTSCINTDPTVSGTASQAHPITSDGCSWASSAFRVMFRGS